MSDWAFGGTDYQGVSYETRVDIHGHRVNRPVTEQQLAARRREQQLAARRDLPVGRTPRRDHRTNCDKLRNAGKPSKLCDSEFFSIIWLLQLVLCIFVSLFECCLLLWKFGLKPCCRCLCTDEPERDAGKRHKAAAKIQARQRGNAARAVRDSEMDPAEKKAMAEFLELPYDARRAAASPPPRRLAGQTIPS